MVNANNDYYANVAMTKKLIAFYHFVISVSLPLQLRMFQGIL